MSSTAHERRRGPVVAAALLVATAGALLATLPGPRQADVPTVAPASEPVSRTLLVCPPGHGDAVVRAVAVADLPGTGGGAADLELQHDGVGGGDAVDARPGELVTRPVGEPPVQVRGTGASARGLLAVRGERVVGTLTGAGCAAPRPTWWFFGAGGGIDHSSVLFLSNAEEGPAVVDVRLHGATGNVDEAATRGITLVPGETRRIPLAEVAPGSDELTVEVVSTRGRVAAHVLDVVATPGGRGREWLPEAAAPGEDVVLPGVAAGADRVRLLVTNPGVEQALVDLQLLTESGAFVPLGNEQLSVPPGAVRRLDLTDELDGRAGAVRLRSETPVAGAVRVSVAGDTGYATTVDPLEGAAGVALVGDRSELQVASGDDPVSLMVLMHDAEGRQLLRRAVTVPPAGLLRVPAPADAAYAVLLPRSGGGHVAAVHTRPGVAGRPASVLPTTLLRPVVLPWTGQSPS